MEEQDVAKRIQDIRRVATAWIAGADIKATAIITVEAVFLAVILAGTLTTRALRPSERVFFAIYCAASLLSMLASILVLWPRTGRAKILKKGGCKPSLSSISFYGDLAKKSYGDFVATMERHNPDEILSDEYEQSYVLVTVASTKMDFMKMSIASLLVALGALSMLAGASVVFPPTR